MDNNTWNNTHISRVGQAMASDEAHAYEIMRELDVDYVLVIFGGLISYSSDGKSDYMSYIFARSLISKNICVAAKYHISLKTLFYIHLRYQKHLYVF